MKLYRSVHRVQFRESVSIDSILSAKRGDPPDLQVLVARTAIDLGVVFEWAVGFE